MKCADVACSVVPRKGDGVPKIEIEFEFDMVFCFGIRLTPYAVFCCFFTRIYNTLHNLLKVIVL